MDEPLAVALKFAFLAVLYLFLLWVARSAMRDLSTSAEGGPSAEERAGVADGQGLRPGAHPRLEVVAAMGHEPGKTFDVRGGAMLGRSDGADILVEDQFASASHARIFNQGQFMYIEDVGSTNGTYLNGRQISTAQRLKRADVIRIGDTEYRYEE